MRTLSSPGVVSLARPPRPRTEGVIRGPRLARAWLFLGGIAATLQMAGFFYVLTRAGWHLGMPVGAGSPLHHAYQQATTMTFMGMIAGQVGTAFAVRTERASLLSVGVFSNRYLLAGICAEIAVAAFFVYVPPMQSLLGTAPTADPLSAAVGSVSVHRLGRRRTAAFCGSLGRRALTNSDSTRSRRVLSHYRC